MTITRRWTIGWLAALSTLLLPLAAAPAQPVATAPLTVFAAASLTNALQDVGKAYTARTGQPVRFSFASSAVVAHQIEAGAKADLFVSADTDWMDDVQKHGLIDPATRRNLLGGRLVLVAPRGGHVRLTIRRGFPLAAALGADGRLATGDPASVPAGRYAKQALTSLGVWPAVAGRLAPAENVRAALALVARGEAPLGVVYETDAAIEPGVKLVGVFPAASHPPIVYPAAVVRGAAPGTTAFYRFLRSRDAQAIFRRYRFQPLG